MIRSLCISVILASFLSQDIVFAQLADSPWPMFQHDIRHTGKSPYVGPTDPDVKWTYKITPVLSSPAIAKNGDIYVCGEGILYSLTSSGQLNWQYQASGNRIESTPAISKDGTIYFISGKSIYDDSLYAMNKNGTLKWTVEMGSMASPAIGFDGTIYCGASWYTLVAINPDGGNKWYSSSRTGAKESSPAIGSNGNIYVTGSRGLLLCHEPDGKIKWSVDLNANTSTSPVMGNDGSIYVGSYNDSLYAIHPDGSKKWSYVCHDAISYSSPAIDSDENIFFGGMDGTFYALEQSGKLKWEYQFPLSVYSSPAIGKDGSLYVGAGNKLYAVYENKAPTVSIFSPKSGDIWQSGDTYQITGKLNDANFGEELLVDFEYSTDNGVNWNAINTLTLTTGVFTYNWIPDLKKMSTLCKIRLTVTDAGGLQAVAVSDLFQINAKPYPPNVTIISPTFQDRWKAGTTQYISFQVEDLNEDQVEILIELY